jgi:23S rRNA (cytidine1920-2'-O)/16S rRNA (cytidine1409-2'-O)-methyltransferase
LVLAGDVSAAGQRVEKPGALLAADAPLLVRKAERYVSRGGLKLEGALQALKLDPTGSVCVDVGASTGGFTDCLLQHGASKVYAVDVGWGQLAQKLVLDERVVVRDRTNARQLEAGDFAEPIDWVVVDASFIGVGKLASALAKICRPAGTLLCMVKPQFEVGREQARKGRGVIRDPELRTTAISDASEALRQEGFEILGGVDSSLPGPKGNVEHFLYAERRA